MTHTNQLFGRLVCTANGAHILRSMKKFDKFGGPIPVIAPAGDILIGDSISLPKKNQMSEFFHS